MDFLVFSDRSFPVFAMTSQVGFPCGSAGKESTRNAGDPGSIPGLGRSPGEGKGFPLQYSGLENSMDCIIHGVAQRWAPGGLSSLTLCPSLALLSSLFCCFQSLGCVWFFATPWAAARQASLSFTISQSFPKLMSIESVMPSNHLILCCPLLLPSIFPSIGVFPTSWLFTSGGQSIGTSASFQQTISKW